MLYTPEKHCSCDRVVANEPMWGDSTHLIKPLSEENPSQAHQVVGVAFSVRNMRCPTLLTALQSTGGLDLGNVALCWPKPESGAMLATHITPREICHQPPSQSITPAAHPELKKSLGASTAAAREEDNQYLHHCTKSHTSQ